ncbi:MAG: glycosyltransferase [Acholeplasmataceae bacterium]|nr:glycosyltransferase [Acholeplasmataceae bacterium]
MTEDKKITIGLFIDVFYPMVDGVVVVVDNYAKQLMQHAHVIVFAPGSRDRKYVDHFPYQVVRSKYIKVPFTDYDLSIPFFDFKFKKVLKNSKLDIVHIHSPFGLGRAGIAYAKENNVPVVATLHSQYKKDFYTRTKSEILSEIAIKEIMHTFNKCDECWAVNHKVAQIFAEYGATQIPKVQLNATDLMPFSDESKIETLKKKYQISANDKIFLYVGRLDALKNLDFTIQSLYRLKLKGYQFKMIFVGSGPHENEMKHMIKKYGLVDYVHFAGKIMDRVELASYYKLAHLFLFPSLYDSSSLVQIEASSQKTPTLFLKGAATADTVAENVNGFLSENDPQLYAQKIMEIMKDTKLYHKVAQQAFKDLYVTWEQATKEVYAKYRMLINHKNQK